MKTTNNAWRGFIYLILAVAGGLSLIPGRAAAEVVFQQLESISGGVSAPEDVAIAPDGRVYVVDAGAGRVSILGANNQPLGALTVDRPTSVAVGSGGYKYIATTNKFHVKIVNSADQVVNYLGNGYNEFVLPLNIAVDDSTGRVYVVDQLDNSIKVYSAAGNFVKRIADPNNQPIDAAVWGNSLYVLDQPLIADSGGGKIRGARVAVFDKTSGAFQRSFGTFGSGIGQLSKSKGITVDNRGTIYISDSFHGVVQCFNTSGIYQGAIQNTRTGEAMATPQGLAVTADGKLYVATSGSNDPPGVKKFSVNRQLTMGPDLLVSPAALAFGAVDIGRSSPAWTVTMTSNGTERLNLGALGLAGPAADLFRIVTDNCSGQSLVTFASCTVEVQATPITEGEFSAALVIPANDPDTPVASLALTVTGVGLPVIAAQPSSLDFGFGAIGEISAPRALTVWNHGTSGLTVTGVTVTGFASGEFLVASDGCSGHQVAPTAGCPIGLIFAPRVEGGRTARLTVHSNDPARQNLVVAMTGQGHGYQEIEVLPQALDFGVIAKGTISARQTVTIANHGTVGLYVGKLAVTGTNAVDFLLEPNTCAERVLPPAAVCDLWLTFYPAVSEGGKAALLSIPSNDPEQSEIKVALKGHASITPEGGVDPRDDPKSSGRWISVIIELPAGFSINEIDVRTVMLGRVNGVTIDPPLPAAGQAQVGDYNRNGVADLMVKFNRRDLLGLLNPGESNITVSGSLRDGTVFEQSSAIALTN